MNCRMPLLWQWRSRLWKMRSQWTSHRFLLLLGVECLWIVFRISWGGFCFLEEELYTKMTFFKKRLSRRIWKIPSWHCWHFAGFIFFQDMFDVCGCWSWDEGCKTISRRLLSPITGCWHFLVIGFPSFYFFSTYVYWKILAWTVEDSLYSTKVVLGGYLFRRVQYGELMNLSGDAERNIMGTIVRIGLAYATTIGFR